MAEPTGYAHAATLATGDPDLAVRLAGELREAREAIQRVRALHQPHGLGVWCVECSDGIDADGRLRGGVRRRWPCATAAALDPPDGTS